jgi:hypothetical protein
VAGALAAGADVGAAGTEVAEDPQANSRATNSRTIALGRCLINHGLELDIGRAPSPELWFAHKNVQISARTKLFVSSAYIHIDD